MVRSLNLSHAAVDLQRIVSRLKPRTAGLERENWIEVRKGYQVGLLQQASLAPAHDVLQTARYARTLLEAVEQRDEL